MSKLLRQNVGGTNYTMAGCALTGVCASAAADYVKVVTLSDGDELSDGMTVIVAFANGNTAGTAPAVKTIYSSDQVNYYEDSGLTTPFTLAPAGCYEITYTGEGNAYNYVAYPVMQVGSVSGPLCDASGNKASGALWLAGDKVSINYANGCFSVIPQTAGFLTVTAASSVVNGAPIRIGSTVRVLFTQDLTGAANTGLVLTYNGVGIPVMVGKNGSLGALLPFDVGGGTYKYLQAYTTLEMTYDGTQFIVLGNPVVISNSDYTVYTDGTTTYKVINRKLLRYYGSVAVGEQVLDKSMNWWNVRDKLIFSINYAMNSAGTNSQNDIMVYPKNDGKLYLNIAHSYQVLDMGGVALILP